MKNNKIWAVMRKEFSRFFGDKRVVISTIFLPGIMIYLVYSLMGSAMGTMMGGGDDYIPTVYAINMGESAETMLAAALDANIVSVDASAREEKLAEISEGDADALIVFSEGMNEVLSGNRVDKIPSVSVYHNSASTNSYNVYNTVVAVLDGYESTVANLFDINAGDEAFDLASEEETAAQIMATMLPMLLMTFMFSACMSVAPESIAGEKERGTVATLLVTPLKRSHLALGKIFSLSCIAVISGAATALGTILSLPKLMSLDGMGIDTSTSVYSVIDYVLLGCVMISTVLLLIAAVSCVSAFAKSVKEASTALAPLMVLSMVVGLSSMFGSATSVGAFFIPLYNSAQSMSEIFSLSTNATHIAITCAMNLVFTGILVFVLTKMFDSEKVMFSA